MFVQVGKIPSLFVGYVIDGNGCWQWVGSIHHSGYGQWFGSSAHRHVYEMHKGQVPAGLELDHLCRNRACVNPGHLEPVTHKVNAHRGRSGPKSYCKYGHSMADAYICKNGRACRQCSLAKYALFRRRRVA